MRFEPPRCPYPVCPRHVAPAPDFYVRRGWYRARCRVERVPRFRCKSCRRTFSRQTFRHDYRDKRPQANAPLFRLLSSSVSLRQAARIVGLDIRSIVQKLAKSGRTCRGLLDNVEHRLPPGRTLILDEEESYEGSCIRTLTVPLLIDRDSTFVLAYDAAPIRRLARAGSQRRARQDHEERHGRRADRGHACVDDVVARVARKLPHGGPVLVHTDEKPSYGPTLRRHFGSRLVHVRTSSKVARDGANPLAPINRAIAMGRDNCARLRRDTWSGTKKRDFLVSQLHLFAAYVNLQRRRFNHDPAHRTPACILGMLPRSLTPEEILGWRQDWGLRSPHPLDASGRRSFGEFVAA